jgi:hypothetical protein
MAARAPAIHDPTVRSRAGTIVPPADPWSYPGNGARQDGELIRGPGERAGAAGQRVLMTQVPAIRSCQPRRRLSTRIQTKPR